MEKEVITFDYKTVRVKREMETMTIDSYENLGWQFIGSTISSGAIFHVNLSFKRDRKIANKQNLLKLQEKIDMSLQNIETLQRSKSASGVIPALSVGIAGTLTFGGGLSMALLLGVGKVGFMIGGIALGLVGIGIALFAMPIYKKMRKKTLANVEPMIEDEYNKLADYCEQAK